MYPQLQRQRQAPRPPGQARVPLAGVYRDLGCQVPQPSCAGLVIQRLELSRSVTRVPQTCGSLCPCCDDHHPARDRPAAAGGAVVRRGSRRRPPPAPGLVRCPRTPEPRSSRCRGLRFRNSPRPFRFSFLAPLPVPVSPFTVSILLRLRAAPRACRWSACGCLVRPDPNPDPRYPRSACPSAAVSATVALPNPPHAPSSQRAAGRRRVGLRARLSSPLTDASTPPRTRVVIFPIGSAKPLQRARAAADAAGHQDQAGGGARTRPGQVRPRRYAQSLDPGHSM